MNRLFAFAALAALTGCGTADLGTGAKLSVDYYGDTDVVGFHFQIDRVSCDGEAFAPFSLVENVNLVDGIFPGMITMLESKFDADSKHLGADLFASLEPGCYDIMAAPARVIDGPLWQSSEDCSAARQLDVVVAPGLTTDITLASQCKGDSVGAVDTLVLVNHPPVLWLNIDEKFNYECEPVNVCATAYDVNDDPIVIEWDKIAGAQHFALNESPLEVVGFEDGHRVWEQCAEIVTRWTGEYSYTATVFDLAANGEKIENMLADWGTEGESHFSFQFPIYTNWVEEPACYDAETETVEYLAEIERYAGCQYTSAEEFYCNAGNSYGVDETVRASVCDDTYLIESAFYPTCDSTEGGEEEPAGEL